MDTRLSRDGRWRYGEASRRGRPIRRSGFRYCERVFGRRKAEDISIDYRDARIRLLSEELDRTRDAALERSRLLNTKASFVVVAAGVIASVSSVGIGDREAGLAWVVPFSLTFLTVLTATVTLWPRKLKVAGGREMVTAWRESELTEYDLVDHLLEVKVQEVESRDAQYRLGSIWTKVAFVFLLMSLISVVVVGGAEAWPTKPRSTDGRGR